MPAASPPISGRGRSLSACANAALRILETAATCSAMSVEEFSILIVDEDRVRATIIEDGLRKDRVKSILDMAILRFNAYSRLQRELDEARTALEDRRLIDRAKAILIEQRGLSVPDAYNLLRKTAMNQNRRIVDIAQSLITAAGLLEP